uniref:Uncharacterized protein n=1 Tax=Molossus molossus TaxID=27622 RepID=A0A7J8CPN7_MOLMO|nr:hypothetical protein HJG59_001768 [Molossus molossus]
MRTQTDVTQKQRAGEHKTQWPQKSNMGIHSPAVRGAPANGLSVLFSLCKMGVALFVRGHFMGGSKESTVSVPKFDNIPWLCEASLRNKPLVPSLPKRYPQTSATAKKDMNLPNLFPVPDDLSKAWRHQSDPVLGRSRPLCPTCREMKMVQPRTMMIPDDLKRSFEHLTSHRMKSLQPPKAQTVPECSRDDLLTESTQRCPSLRGERESAPSRLPILGPRTAAFYRLLSDAWHTLQEAQGPSSPGRQPTGRTARQRVIKAFVPDSQRANNLDKPDSDTGSFS